MTRINPLGRSTTLCHWLVILLAFAVSPAIASACTIPVFRYALERWDSDRFQVIIYHDGPLSAQQVAAWEKLEQQSVVRGGELNIECIRCDVSAPALPKLLDAERPSPEQPLPVVEVRARVGETRWARRWQGPFAAAITEPGLFDSPARQEIVRRILDGHAAVWLVVAPDAEQGKQVSAALQESLAAAVRNIPPPQGIGSPGSELLASVPLELRFSVLTLSHQDAAEVRFLQLLSASVTDWKADETYVVPVFGRCRALEVVPYADLDAATTEEIAQFICGACSCQIKQANPGFDLLVAVDWEAKLFGAAAAPISDDASTNSAVLGNQPRTDTTASSAPEYVDIPSGQDLSAENDTERIAAGVLSALPKAAALSPTSTEQSSQIREVGNRGIRWSTLALGGLALGIVVVGVGLRMATERNAR